MAFSPPAAEELSALEARSERVLAALMALCLELPRGGFSCVTPSADEIDIYKSRVHKGPVCRWSLIQLRMNFDDKLRASADLL